MLDTILLTILKIAGTIGAVAFIGAVVYGFWKYTKWTFKDE